MKYIAFYDVPEIKNENRYVNAAARGVIAYMIEALSFVEDVEVISPGRTLNQSGRYPSRRIPLSEKAVLNIPFSFGVRTKLGRLLSLLWTQVWLFSYLFRHTKRGEKVVFYHSLSLMKIISLLAKIKRIQPILEFREIYSDINPVSKRLTKREHSYYKCAYAFIFPSKSLRDRLDIPNAKPCLYAPGSYLVNDFSEQSFEDGKIHAVYAGNLRKDKGGAYLAVEAAPFLSKDYIIHILSGSADDGEIVAIERAIKQVNMKHGCKVVFDGAKFGEEFYSFLNRCLIGLATQNDGDFSNTSFPSKILTYLGCGLKVVAPPIEAVELSPVGDMVSYYTRFSPECVATTIEDCAKRADISVKDRISELDKQLKHDLKAIF